MVCKYPLTELSMTALIALDANDEIDAKAERLDKLSAFQLQMLQHAFKCM